MRLKFSDWGGALGWIAVFLLVLFVATKGSWFDAMTGDDKALFWASVAQVIAVLAAASAATWAVFYQLNRFNDNERLKTTIELLQQYETATFPTGFGEERLASGVSFVLELEDPGRLANFVMAGKLYKGKNKKEADTLEGRAYFLLSNSSIMVSNYFSKVDALLKRNVVDRDLYFAFLSDFIKRCYAVCERVSLLEHWSWSIKGFKSLRDSVLEWENARP